MEILNRKLLVLFIVAVLIASCSTAAPEPTATPVPVPTAPPTAAPPEVAAVVLTIAGPDSTVELTMDDIRAMPAVEGWGGIKNSVGNITVPAQYKGVALSGLLELVGGLGETAGINVVAEDGYAMTLAYDQVSAGDFVTCDPGTGDENDPGGQLLSAIAYEVDGQPLPEKTDGKLRLVVLGPINSQVTDGH